MTPSSSSSPFTTVPTIADSARWRALATGILFGIGMLMPYLGRFAGWPARTLAIPVIVAGIIVGWPRFQALLQPLHWILRTAMLCAVLILVAVMLQSSDMQWSVALDPGQWRPEAGASFADNYYSRKLILYLMSYGPALFALLIMVKLPKSQINLACRGILIGVLVIALLSVIRFSSVFPLIVATDLATSELFYAPHNAIKFPYSTVSLGITLLGGIIAGYCLWHPEQAKWQQVFLIACVIALLLALFLTRQRATLIFALFGLFALTVLRAWASVTAKQRRQCILFGAGAILIAACVAPFITNEYIRIYWQDFLRGSEGQTAQQRLEMLEQSGMLSSPRPSPATAASIAKTSRNTPLAGVIGSKAVEHAQDLRLVGRGFGSFAILSPKYLYPHNPMLEAWYELGAPIAFAVALLFFIGLLGPFLGFRAVCANPYLLGLWAYGGALLSNGMKAGDFSSLGVLLFFLLIPIASLLQARVPARRGP